MKLRNKKTGKTGILIVDGAYNFVTNFAVEDDERNRLGKYCSLAELNEEWEDVPEEPKEHWCITMYGGITRIKDDEEPIEDLIEIGNYFSSKEDAYDAWDKLEAWQRLKDKGAEFYGWRRNQTGTYELYLRWKDRIPRSYEVKNDLDLLFSREGEE